MRTMSMKGGNMGYTGKVRCIKGKYFNVIEEVDFNLDEYIEEKIEDVKAKEQQKPKIKSKEVNTMSVLEIELSTDTDGNSLKTIKMPKCIYNINNQFGDYLIKEYGTYKEMADGFNTIWLNRNGRKGRYDIVPEIKTLKESFRALSKEYDIEVRLWINGKLHIIDNRHIEQKEEIGMAKIIVEGRVTYALEGGKVGVAICSPTDNYDREFGERLALARLHNDKVAENELMLGLTTDWTKVEKDTKVIVNGCTKAHFAQYVNGTVWTYPFGKTSFTIDPNMPLRGNYPKYVKIFE